MNWIRTMDGTFIRADLLEKITFAHEQEQLSRSSPQRTLGRNTPTTIYGHFRSNPGEVQKHALNSGYPTMVAATDAATKLLLIIASEHEGDMVADISQF